MGITKNDLSHNEVKLDLNALLTTAQVAFYSRFNAIREEINELDNLYFNGNSGIRRYILANNIANLSKSLPILAETLHTLEEGRSRENIVLVNEEEYRK